MDYVFLMVWGSAKHVMEMVVCTFFNIFPMPFWLLVWQDMAVSPLFASCHAGCLLVENGCDCFLLYHKSHRHRTFLSNFWDQLLPCSSALLLACLRLLAWYQAKRISESMQASAYKLSWRCCNRMNMMSCSFQLYSISYMNVCSWKITKNNHSTCFSR